MKFSFKIIHLQQLVLFITLKAKVAQLQKMNLLEIQQILLHNAQQFI